MCVKPLVLIRELAGGYGKNGTKMNKNVPQIQDTEAKNALALIN